MGLPKGWAEKLTREAFFRWKPHENQESRPENISAKKEINEAKKVNNTAKKESDVIKKAPEIIKNDLKAGAKECQAEEEEKNNQEKGEGNKQEKEEIFTSSDCYNGAKFENYCWSQSIKEVDVTVQIPEKITTRDLSVTIKPKSLSVKFPKGNSVILEGELCNKCKHHDALWSLDKSKLEIHLEKTVEAWWDCLLTQEPKLDVKSIDCTRPFEELSEEAQAKIEELSWNQERKRKGLPTKEEMVRTEQLKKAWGAEGSPFRGPFDPSAVDFITDDSL